MSYESYRTANFDVHSDDNLIPVHGRLIKKSSGEKGVYETVQVMKRLKIQYRKNPLIRGLALKIIKNTVQGRLNYVKALYEWIIRNVKYVPDVLDVETLMTPILAVRLRAGDCDDLAMLFSSLAESIGVPTSYVITSYNPDKIFTHIYNYAHVDGKKIPIDTAKRRYFGYEKQDYSRKEEIF